MRIQAIRGVKNQLGKLSRTLFFSFCIFFGGTLIVTGCGGDDEASEKKKKKKGKKTKAKPKKAATTPHQAGKAGSSLTGYVKLEEKFGKDTGVALRREFIKGDFYADVNGEENRNPFRSYVVRGVPLVQDKEKLLELASKRCLPSQIKAVDHDVGQLRITGIVSRTAALFADSSGYGHIIRRNDCLGSEKAKVTEIASTYVRIERIADRANPDAQQTTSLIALHPEELKLKESKP